MSRVIRVEGTVGYRQDLADALHKYFGEVEVVWGDASGRLPQAESVTCNDLLICFLNPADKQQNVQLFRFLREVVGLCGAWSYLPQVVVGEPADPRLADYYRKLGASRYVGATCAAAQVARIAFEAWRMCWWHGECQRDVPVFVVNRGGVIERANPYARLLFPDSALVGCSYAEVVEGGAAGAPLPADHPIARAIDGEHGVSEARVVHPGGREKQLFLSCNPLFRPSPDVGVSPPARPAPAKAVHAAAVWTLHMGRWPRIIAASNDFARAAGRADLYRKIVEQGQMLGFRRLRLYEYNSAENLLQGVASVGFATEGRAEEFLSFRLRLQDDWTSDDISKRASPRLYVPRAPAEKDSELERHFTGRSRQEKFLEKEGLAAWIEAPIRLPPGADGQPRFWGKLSLDNGRSCKPLDVRDIGDVALFCSVAGLALAMIQRVETETGYRELVDQSSEKLIRGLRPDVDIHQLVVDEVLALYLKLTGADVALYRQHTPHPPETLRLVGKPKFVRPEDEGRYAVPVEPPRGPVLGDYFRHFAAGAMPPFKPEILTDLPQKKELYLRSHGADFKDDKERAYVGAIRSEMHIPVFRGDEVCGVVVVANWEADKFTPSQVALVEQYMHPVSIWIELARRNDSQRKTQDALGTITQLLPRLATLPLDRDDAFFAGLAAILSSHLGLSWNRVFIFSCQAEGTRLRTAELVYALGGLDEDYSDGRHVSLQAGLRGDDRYATLKDLVEARIKRPDPSWVARDGREVRDRLYDLLIRDKPADNAASTSIEYEEVRAPGGSRPGADQDASFTVTVKWNHSAVPVLKQGSTFPLGCTFEEYRRPLGFVQVEMLRLPDVDALREEDMVAATRVVLDLVSDILAMRYMRRQLGWLIDSLPVVSHHSKLKRTWDVFGPWVGKLLDALPDDWEVDQATVEGLLLPLLHRSAGNPEFVRGLREALDFIGKSIHRLDGETKPLCGIPDLGAYLERLQRKYEDAPLPLLHVRITWADEVMGLALPCDEIVFREMLMCFLENTEMAVSKARQDSGAVASDEKVLATIHVRVVTPAVPGNFRQFVEVLYEDEGPGIAEADRPFIMIDGYTSAAGIAAGGKGRGLALLAAQLNAHHGCLEFVDENNPIRDGRRKAMFAVRFGIPPESRGPGRARPRPGPTVPPTQARPE